MGTMYLPMERSKYSIIVSELTLLGTKNCKQTKVQADGVNKPFRNLKDIIQCSILYS